MFSSFLKRDLLRSEELSRVLFVKFQFKGHATFVLRPRSSYWAWGLLRPKRIEISSRAKHLDGFSFDESFLFETNRAWIQISWNFSQSFRWKEIAFSFDKLIHHLDSNPMFALLNTFPLLVLMSSIYLIDVVIRSLENYQNIIKRKRARNALLSLSVEAGNFLSIYFQWTRKLFMISDLCGNSFLRWMSGTLGMLSEA